MYYTAEINGPILNLLDPKPLMEFGLSNRLWTFYLKKKPEQTIHQTTKNKAEKENVTSGVSSKPEGTSQQPSSMSSQ